MATQSPNWLDDKGRRKVSDAVAAAEAGSSAEIVTILAERSDNYSDVALAWSAFIAFTALVVLSLWPNFYLAKIAWLSGHWNLEWTTAHAFAIAALVALLKFAGMWLLQLWKPLKFFLIPRFIKTERVHQRAIAAFRIGAELRTRGRTGILIYLSMHEHRAAIIADEAISARVAPERWGDAMAAMLAELEQGRVAEGMCAAIAQVGAILASELPREADDINELPDRLIEL